MLGWLPMEEEEEEEVMVVLEEGNTDMVGPYRPMLSTCKVCRARFTHG